MDTIKSIKREATILSKKTGTPKRQVLDQKARQAGFNHWGSYAATLKKDEGPSSFNWTQATACDLPAGFQAIIGKYGPHLLAVNSDGNLWMSFDPMGEAWQQFQRTDLDSDADTVAFLRRVDPAARNTSFTVLQHEGVMYRMAAILPDASGSRPLSLVMRRLPTDLVEFGDFGMEQRDWTLLLVARNARNANFNAGMAASIGYREQRMLLIGASLDTWRHPNQTSIPVTSLGVSGAFDIITRYEANGIVIDVKRLEEALLALRIARFEGPTVPVVAIIDGDDGEEMNIFAQLCDHAERRATTDGDDILQQVDGHLQRVSVT